MTKNKREEYSNLKISWAKTEILYKANDFESNCKNQINPNSEKPGKRWKKSLH